LKQSILVLSIASLFILFAGLIPISFEYFIGSPKHQLESGVAPEDITCRDNLVLVIRTNGNPACVKDSTSERFGWEKIEKSSQSIIDVELDPILYSGAPISSKMFEVPTLTNSNTTTEEIGFPSDNELIISKFPRVGDVIDVTFTTTYMPPVPDQTKGRVNYFISDGMEFVSTPDGYELSYREPQTHLGKYYPGTYTLTSPYYDFESDIPQSFTVQIQALTEGVNSINAKVRDQGSGIGFVIGSQETLLTTDYYLLYPGEYSEEISVDLPTTPQEQAEFEKKYGYSFGTTTIRTDIAEEEYRLWLENYGMSESEIIEILDRVFPKD